MGIERHPCFYRQSSSKAELSFKSTLIIKQFGQNLLPGMMNGSRFEIDVQQTIKGQWNTRQYRLQKNSVENNKTSSIDPKRDDVLPPSLYQNPFQKVLSLYSLRNLEFGYKRFLKRHHAIGLLY